MGPVYTLNKATHGFDEHDPRAGPALTALDNKLVGAYRAALAESARHHCRHIGFCLLSAGKFRGGRSLREVVELAVRCLAHAVATSSGATPLTGAPHLFDRVTLIGYTAEEQSLLAELGQAVGSELDAGGHGGGPDPQELFVNPFDVAVEMARVAELATAPATSDAERVQMEAERRELEQRSCDLADAQAVLRMQELGLQQAQAALAQQAGATEEQRRTAEQQLEQVRMQEVAARARMQREEQTLKASVNAAAAAAEAQHAKVQAERAAAEVLQAKAADERKAAEAQKAAAEAAQSQAEAAKAEAAKAKADAEKAAAAAKAEVERSGVPSQLWGTLNGGLRTVAEVEQFVAQRQTGLRSLTIESAVCIANESALRSFNSAGNFTSDKLAAEHKGDSLLFHGTNEASVANIQAGGRPSMQFAANGNLGRGIYGAPDPMKSLQYTSGHHGKFMFICRYNLCRAKHGTFGGGLHEFCVYDDNDVVVLWMLKLKQ